MDYLLFLLFPPLTKRDRSEKSFQQTRASRPRVSDRNARENPVATKVPPPWETASEGRLALLRAARDADDAALNQIEVQVRKFGARDMNVNIADSSGRVSSL